MFKLTDRRKTKPLDLLMYNLLKEQIEEFIILFGAISSLIICQS